MADPALAIKVLANLTEVRKAFQEQMGPVLATTKAQLAQASSAFDGAKIISQANAAVEAVTKLGGASKLTEAEQSKLNKTLGDAIEKYRALGSTAPGQMQALFDATRKVESATSSADKGAGIFGGTMTKLAGAFAIGSLIDKVAGGILDFGKSAIETAGHVVDLSNKTGLSIKAVQQYSFVAEQTGGTVDNFADAVFKLGNKMADGGVVVEHGLRAIGTSLSEIRSLKPEDQFDKIMRALASIEDPTQRNAIGVELMGKAYANVAGSVSDYIDLMGQAPVASDAAVKATDAAADAVGRAWTKAKTTAIDALGAIIMAVEKGVSGAGATAGANMAFGPRPALGQANVSVAAQQTQSTAAPAAAAIAQAGAAALTAAERFKAARQEILNLTTAQRADIDANIKLTGSIGDLAGTYHLTEDAVKVYASVVQETSAASSQAASAAAKAQSEATRVVIALQNQDIAKRKELQAVWDAQYDIASKIAKGIADEFIQNQKRVDAIMANQVAQAQAKARAIADTFVQTRQMQAQAQDLMDKRTLSSVDYQILQIHKWAAQQKADFQGTQEQAEAYFAAVDHLADESVKALNVHGQVVADNLGHINDLMGIIGANTSGASQQFVSGVQQMISVLETFAQTGDKAAAASSAGWLIVLGAVTGTINAFKESGQIKAAIKDVRQQIIDLGGTPIDGTSTASSPSKTGRQDLEALQKQLSDLQKAQQLLNDTMGRYGLSLDDVGTASERLTRSGKKLADDFTLLASKGFTVQQVTKGAAAQLNEMIGAALAGKQQLPASLAPYIAELVKSGGFTDDLKRKILGLADPVPWKDMQAAAEKYGISVNDLGTKFQQAKLDETVGQLASDWKLLADNGANMDAVLAGMGSSIQDVITNAMKFGLAIPDSMKDVIQKFVDSGRAVDDNKEALTDVSKLKFADPIMSDTDRLITKLDELIAKLTGPDGVAAAMSALTFPDPTGSAGSAPGKAHSGAIVLANGIRRYHAGAARVIPFPQMTADEFPAILQTGEAVLNRRAVQTMGEPAIAAMNRGQSTGGSVVVQITNHIHPTPGMSEQQLADKVGSILERNTSGVLTRVRRVVNG